MTTSPLNTAYIQAASFGGPFKSGRPRIGLLHDVEAPLEPGYAVSLARFWFATPAAGTSTQYIVDPVDTVGMVPEENVAWGAGNINGWVIHVEQGGYARFTRDEWLTPNGLKQMRRLAELMADLHRRKGIELRWLTVAELTAAYLGNTDISGWATHDDAAKGPGGTGHWDPGYSYPKAELMALARQIAGLDKPTPEPLPEPAPPAPLPPTTGDVLEELTMALKYLFGFFAFKGSIYEWNVVAGTVRTFKAEKGTTAADKVTSRKQYLQRRGIPYENVSAPKRLSDCGELVSPV